MSATLSSILDRLPAESTAEGAEVPAPAAQVMPTDEPAGPIAGGLDSLCDEELLRRYIDDDDQLAFQVLYGRYRLRLHRFVRRLCGNAHEAEEIFQETWLAVIRRKVRYDPRARFAAYLFSIAHRRLADRWRRLQRSTPSPIDGDIPLDPDEVADDLMVTPEEWTQHAQLQNALMAELSKLPVTQREVFLMKAEADLSLEEIATITEATHEATKSRLRYALGRLRAALRTWK